jgi:hypothetical protein
MTFRGLLAYFEEFYGEKYSGVFLDTMTKYLNKYSADFYNAATEVLVKRFSRTYNKAPGPTEFEKYFDEILHTMPKPKKLPEPETQIATQEEKRDFINKLKKMLHMKKA